MAGGVGRGRGAWMMAAEPCPNCARLQQDVTEMHADIAEYSRIVALQVVEIDKAKAERDDLRRKLDAARDALKENALDWLSGTWLELRDDAGPARRAYMGGAIDLLRDIGLLNEDEQTGWSARRRQCPGHDDEGGRDWCAFCGKLEPSVPADG